MLRAPTCCRWRVAAAGVVLSATSADAQFRIASLAGAADVLGVAAAFTNGVCTVEQADALGGGWYPAKNVFTTNPVAEFALGEAGDSAGFCRAVARDLSGGRSGFVNLGQAYGVLTTIAGAGGTDVDDNEWREEFEGGPAVNALLSTPHMAMANQAGEVFIADKDAHAVRKITLNGAMVTVLGNNQPGDGPDTATPGPQVGLNAPNGLWVTPSGRVYVLDLGNGKVRRLGTDGMVVTLFSVPGGILAGRGLWVNDEETTVYVSSLTVVKKWTAAGGVVDFAAGFTELGNLTVDPKGSLVVTDRGAHSVWRISDDGGSRVRIAGNGTNTGGGDGQPATSTGLDGVRGVAFLPTGAFFVCTHRGSQVWYIDLDGTIHLFLNGHRNDTHAGDGTWFYNPAEYRVSENRSVSVDWEGNLLIAENDRGYVRKVRFLPYAPD